MRKYCKGLFGRFELYKNGEYGKISDFEIEKDIYEARIMELDKLLVVVKEQNQTYVESSLGYSNQHSQEREQRISAEQQLHNLIYKYKDGGLDELAIDEDRDNIGKELMRLRENERAAKASEELSTEIKNSCRNKTSALQLKLDKQVQINYIVLGICIATMASSLFMVLV